MEDVAGQAPSRTLLNLDYLDDLSSEGENELAGGVAAAESEQSQRAKEEMNEESGSGKRRQEYKEFRPVQAGRSGLHSRLDQIQSSQRRNAKAVALQMQGMQV
jgi:hypothetical protein